MSANQPYLMTVVEFLSWDAPDRSERWQLIDGEPVAMTPSRPRRQGRTSSPARRCCAM
jgi:hypothetical protein